MTTEIMEKVNEYIIPYHWAWEGFYKESYEWPVKKILPYINKTDKVLDVGCGDGKLTYFLAQKSNNVTGVDNQELPLQFAKLIFSKLKLKIKFKKDDATKLGFKDESFDKVTCFDMIEHVPVEMAKKVVEEINRVLKKYGMLILTTPNRKELRGRIFGHKIIDKHYYEYDINELKQMLEQQGFTNIKFNGYYLPLPIPKIEHYANIFPIRGIFKFLIKAGNNFPNLATGILVTATKK